MTDYVRCPRRKNGRIHQDICTFKCPEKYYMKCEVNREAIEEIERRWEAIPDEDV